MNYFINVQPIIYTFRFLGKIKIKKLVKLFTGYASKNLKLYILDWEKSGIKHVFQYQVLHERSYETDDLYIDDNESIINKLLALSNITHI